ncbi:hypothetical protein P0L94_00790 [Microbacter sp. GSS18]|nr:hypothetical protein P0L94_00790 [Microbacter sp. GSS18]
MTSDPQTEDPGREAEEPTAEQLEEPSTETEPGDEPKAGDTSDAEPSHEAVGIGVITSGDEAEPHQGAGEESGDASVAQTSGDEGEQGGDPPSPAMTDEVRREAAESQG